MPRVHARHLDAHRARRRGPAALPRVHGRAVQGADAQDVRRQDAPHAGARALARSNPPSPTLTRTDSEWLSSQLLFFKSLFDVAAARAERQLKRATFGTFEIVCDESAAIGGEDAAPPPLAYFASSIAF